jgi:translation initiation factor 3 subunit D
VIFHSDYVPVNETWTEQFASDKESVNHPDQLSIEATFINHSFSQQILSSTAPSHNFDRPNPFLDALDKGQEAAHVAFRYRKWELPGGVELVARCSLNGFTEKKDSDGEKSFFLARALNEADSKLQGSVDWRQKLESQTGAVLASEMRNNGYKLARWTAESVLSGADDVKLGFVSRVNPKNNNKHAILMTKQYSPQTFADSVNVKVKNLWGTLSTLIAHLKKLEDGHYLLSRDPNKTQLHIHAIPQNAFEHELDMDGEDGFDEQQ